MSASPTPSPTFRTALRFFRKRNRLTQEELGRAVGYSREQIARLENGSRQPDITAITALFIPALALNEQEGESLLQLAHQARDGHSPTPRYQLPAPLVPLIGRTTEQQQLAALLTQTRLLTLVGAPGIGKTRLALEVAQQSNFADGAAFVALASLDTAADVIHTLLTSLGITSSHDDEATLITHLANNRLLLVLDNCEQLLPDLSLLVGRWLERLPHLTLLCTSREPLDLYGEQLYTVPPLELPEPSAAADIGTLTAIPAMALLLARVRAHHSSFTLSAENAPALITLCHALDGLPLALELAAVQLPSHAPATIIAQLHSLGGTAWLRQHLHNIAPRHRTLQLAIDWSVRLLSMEQQQAFAQLSIFHGGGDETAVLAVTDCQRDTLTALARANLIDWQAERITQLETLRVDGFARLLAQNQVEACQERHATYYATFANNIYHGLLGDEQSLWAERALRDHPNLLAAVRWAINTQNGALAIALTGHLWWFWYRQGLLTLGRELLTAALQLTTPNLDQRAQALNGLASICMELHATAESLQYHQEGLALRQQLGDPAGVSIVLHNMALTAYRMNEYEQAIDWLLEAIATTPDSANALNYAHLGLIAQEMDNLEQGRLWFETAQALAKTADSWTQAFVACNYADLLCTTGVMAQAQALAEMSLRLFIDQHDTLYLSDAQMVLAKIALAQGADEDAIAWCDQAIIAYRQRQQWSELANALLLQVQLTLRAGNKTMAQIIFDEAQAVALRQPTPLAPLVRQRFKQIAAALQA